MTLSLILSISSISIAIISAYFAYVAIKSSQKASMANLLFELHKLYQDISTSSAVKNTWNQYLKILEIEYSSRETSKEKARNGIQISDQSASKYNSDEVSNKLAKK